MSANNKQFKVTANGFVKITTDGVTIHTFFYHAGDEVFWESEGYARVYDSF